MIGRIHERREFERLSRHGRRARTETLWCRYLDEPQAEPPRIAFAIGRSVGPAVVRNRLRRRLRALAADHARTGLDDPLLPHGSLLIGARPSAAERSFEELGVELTTLLRTVRSSAGPS
ncbi:MAG: ribonuclease P protein component [Ilumatobacteraceae bacterium]